MNEIELYITRHGETDANMKGIVAGHTDVELHQNGIEQATLLAKHLSKIKLAKIYSSDLKRAKQTAELVASKQNCSIEYFPLLRERNFGEKEGTKNSEYYITLGDNPSQNQKADYTPKGAESLTTVAERCKQLVEKVLTDQLTPILLVGHLSVNRTLLMNLLQMTAIERMGISQANCALTLVKYNLITNKFSLEYCNDTSHLN